MGEKEFKLTECEVPNWAIQRKHPIENRENEAAKILDYVFLRKQTDSCALPNESIVETQRYYRDRRHRSLTDEDSESKKHALNPVVAPSRDITADIVQNPLDLFDYPIPDELLQYLLVKEHHRFPSIEVLKQLHKVPESKTQVCLRDFKVHRVDYIKKFSDLYALMKRYKVTTKRKHRYTQTDECLIPEMKLGKQKQTKQAKVYKKNITCTDSISPYTILMKQLRQLDTASSTDICIQVGCKIFKAHRVILMALSGWFCKTLNEAHYDVLKIQVDGIDPEIFEILLKWMYSYKLSVTPYTIPEVAIAAKQLQMPLLLRKIKSMIHAMVVTQGPVAMLDVAEKCRSSILLAAVAQGMKENFAVISSSQVFLNYTEEELLWLLSRRYIRLPTEYELLTCFVHWLVHSWEERNDYVDDLLSFINYQCLSSDEIMSSIVLLRDSSIHPDEKCRDLLFHKFLCHFDQRTNKPFHRYISPCPSPKYGDEANAEYLTKASARYPDLDCHLLRDVVNIQCKLKAYEKFAEDIPKLQEKICTSLPESDLSKKMKLEHKSATILQAYFRGYIVRKKLKSKTLKKKVSPRTHTYIMLFGGIDPFVKSGELGGSKIYCYSVGENRWGSLEQLPVPRHHAAAAVLHGAVYVTGGSEKFDSDFFQATNTVWCYEGTSQKWSTKQPMISHRFYHSLHSLKGRLFAIGGLDKDKRVLRSIEVYDPATNIWTESSSLEFGRMGMATTVYKDAVLLCGGVGEDEQHTSLLLRSCEIFIPETQKVLKMKPLRIPRCFASLVVFQNQLFLLGGATIKNDTVISIGDIDVWDEQNKHWASWGHLHIPRHDMVIAVTGIRMFVIGGQTSQSSSTVIKVECFDYEKQKWIQGIANLPHGLSGAACGLLEDAVYLPLKILVTHDW